jgi:glucose-6-phosphate isomerase
MQDFSGKIREKKWLGVTGKPITDIVNIGIGGSHLGPLFTIHALSDFADKDLRCHFISNIDSSHIHEILLKINPETTLFIVSSKSFSTLETITNAISIRSWFKDQLKTDDLSKHWVAVTAEVTDAKQFGIPEENIFPLWDWVGGRYSIWSAIGLPLAILIGMKRFQEFLSGGHAMDEHFRTAPLKENIPVILALLSLWYINFFGTQHYAIIPYSHHLNYLRLYLQQLEMESNGKNTSNDGTLLDFPTSPIIFGEQGCNGQHSFHQLLHQGQHFVPVDFILVGLAKKEIEDHHHILVGSGLSQAQALMSGKSYEEAYAELQAYGLSQEESHYLAQHKTIPGNRPSNILFIDQISPRTLGLLIALYEHKTFVQGVIWGINSFDQWGVELGKKLLPDILENLKSEKDLFYNNDSSTMGLIKHFKNMRNST